jgi:hypothetical protein
VSIYCASLIALPFYHTVPVIACDALVLVFARQIVHSLVHCYCRKGRRKSCIIMVEARLGTIRACTHSFVLNTEFNITTHFSFKDQPRTPHQLAPKLGKHSSIKRRKCITVPVNTYAAHNTVGSRLQLRQVGSVLC